MSSNGRHVKKDADKKLTDAHGANGREMYTQDDMHTDARLHSEHIHIE